MCVCVCVCVCVCSYFHVLSAVPAHWNEEASYFLLDQTVMEIWIYPKVFSYNTFLISFCRYVITRQFLTEMKLGRKPKVDLFHFPNTWFYAVLIFTCSCGVFLSILGGELDFIVGDSQVHRQEVYFSSLLESSNPKFHITALVK